MGLAARMVGGGQSGEGSSGVFSLLLFFFFLFSVVVGLFLKRGRSMVTLEVGLLGVRGFGWVSELVACEREHCGAGGAQMMCR